VHHGNHTQSTESICSFGVTLLQTISITQNRTPLYALSKKMVPSSLLHISLGSYYIGGFAAFSLPFGQNITNTVLYPTAE
jgi:hypothetical protein